jgi:hypothetical protein
MGANLQLPQLGNLLALQGTPNFGVQSAPVAPVGSNIIAAPQTPPPPSVNYSNIYNNIQPAIITKDIQQNPAQLQQFLQGEYNNIYTDVVKQKENTFNNVYGGLQTVTEEQGSNITLDKRNQDLAEIQEQLYSKVSKTANDIIEDKNLAGRKYEMNQWSVSNKNDTLFVYSTLFILLSILILLTGLWNLGLISGSLSGGLSAFFIVIFILIVIYRANFTNVWRNNRYWNRRTFEGKYGLNITPICSS